MLQERLTRANDPNFQNSFNFEIGSRQDSIPVSDSSLLPPIGDNGVCLDVLSEAAGNHIRVLESAEMLPQLPDILIPAAAMTQAATTLSKNVPNTSATTSTPKRRKLVAAAVQAPRGKKTQAQGRHPID